MQAASIERPRVVIGRAFESASMRAASMARPGVVVARGS
jgi:hypothetical protein